MIETVKGTVQDGSRNASENLQPVQGLIAHRSGLDTLHQGTLNVDLGRHYPIVSVSGVITDSEYNHEQEIIKLRRCRIRRLGDESAGFRGVIIRPSQHEDPITKARKGLWNRFEVMSPHSLRGVLGVKTGDEVLIELEQENAVDEEWWNKSEP
jgi:hypothetical protein